jgi:hypothetical protein
MELKFRSLNFAKNILNKFNNKIKFSQGLNIKNLNLSKILAINFTFLLTYFLNNKKANTYLFSHTNSKSQFNYLLELNLKDVNFTRKKCAKIIFLRTNQSIDSSAVENNFKKIHSKYKELESYIVDLRHMNLNDLDNLLKSYGKSLKDLTDEEDLNKFKEKLISKPFLFFNKYGDVNNYTLDEFNEISKADSIFNYFEKLTILNNKHDLLILNDYDYAFVVYLDGKNIDYTDPNFKTFRRLYFLLNFFNIKFFVATKEHSQFLDKANLQIKNVYLVKRENMLQTQNTNIFELENENFESINITNELSNIPIKIDDSNYKI